MQFNKINKIILFGGAPLLVATAKWIKSTDFSLRVYTSPRHAAEVLDSAGQTLQQALDQLEVSYVITDDINEESTLLDEITPHTLGIGMGEAWSFSAEIIEKFSGQLLDFMGIPHPRYRGGAHYTWMILRGDKLSGCNLQVINTDMVQGVFDSGEMVKSETYRFPETARIPMDYFNAAVKQEVNFIRSFLEEIISGKDFELVVPDESRSLYLPRLNTLQQAWINWAWNGADIEKFICAFDEPYAGASTYINNMRVHLKDAVLDKTEAPFHPFQSGFPSNCWRVPHRLPPAPVTRVTVPGHFGLLSGTMKPPCTCKQLLMQRVPRLPPIEEQVSARDGEPTCGLSLKFVTAKA
jgi:hypothetical protein